MIGIGIDIGSTAAKAAVVDGEGSVAWTCVQPTGFSSVDASERLREALAAAGYDVADDDERVIATGYGRVAVPYAHKVVTEITCHGTGAVRLFGDHGTVIDVGGQDTKVIQLKGGRVAKFSALMVVGDGKGNVGVGMGKSAEVPLAISKASLDAKKNMFHVPVTDQGTIPHEVLGHFGAGRIIIKPAVEGTGVIAGGAVRPLFELAGIKNVLSKSLGTDNGLNIIKAAVEGLKELSSPEDVAARRGLTVSEMFVGKEN